MTMVALKGLMISKQKNNRLRLLVNRTIIELLLHCIEKLRNIFFTYFIGKNTSLSQENAFIWENIFQSDQDLGEPEAWSRLDAKIFSSHEWNFFVGEN